MTSNPTTTTPSPTQEFTQADATEARAVLDALRVSLEVTGSADPSVSSIDNCRTDTVCPCPSLALSTHPLNHPVKEFLRAALLATVPRAEDADLHSSVLSEIKQWADHLEGLASRKRARSLSSPPSSQRVKKKRATDSPKAAPVEEAATSTGEDMDVDDTDRGAMGGGESDSMVDFGQGDTAMSTDEGDSTVKGAGEINTATSANVQVPDEGRKALDMLAVQRLVLRDLRGNSNAWAHARRYLASSYHKIASDDALLASNILGDDW